MLEVVMRRALFTILALTILSGPLGAEGLKELIREALIHNEQIKSSLWGYRESQFAFKETRGQLFPKLWFQAEGMRSNNPPFVWMSKMSRADVDPGMMNLKGFNNPSAVTSFSSSINLSYPLYHGGAIKNATEAKRLAATSSLMMSRMTEEEVALEVARTYLEVAWLKSRVKAAASYVESSRYHLKQAESRYRAGAALKSDVLKAKVYLTKAEEKLIRERTSLEIARRRLSLLVGRSPETPTDTENDLEELYRKLRSYRPSVKEGIEEALKNRKDLRSQKLKVEIARRQVKIALSRYLPQVDLTSSFTWYGHNYPLQGEQSSWAIGGVLKIDLFDGLSREYRVKRAKAARLKEEYNYSYLKKQVELQVISAVKRLEDARERVRLTKESVKEAEESLRIMERRYGQGLATITELTDTQRYLEEAQSMYLGALYGYVMSVYQTEFAKGTFLRFVGISGR